MKKISILLFAVFILFGCANNNEASNKVASNKEASTSVNGLVWHHNIEKAIEIAKKENKPVLVQFSGSDWCKWCIRLNKEVMNTKGFADYAKDNLILVNIDLLRNSPQPAEVVKYNRMQMSKYHIDGFPTVLLLDKNGKVVKQTGYLPGGPTSYIANIKEAYGVK